MKLSIIIPYYNRRELLENVLQSIRHYRKDDVEIIIIDDGSDIRLDNIPDTKIIRLEKTGWRGPGIAYNTGFKAATGNAVMLNSSECLHLGNVIDYTFKYFSQEFYMCFSAYMARQENSFSGFDWGKAEVERRLFWNIAPLDYWWGTNSMIGNFIPYCAVISKENIDKLGGYDERFAGGVGFDDYDFIHRIKNLKLKMVPVNYPFVVHQWHKPTDYPNTRNLEMLNYLNLKFPDRIKANVAS